MEERSKPSGSIPYANCHVQSPRNDPQTIKSDAIYPMEASVMDVDAVAHVVPLMCIAFPYCTSHILSVLSRKPLIIIIVRGRLCRTRMADV